MVSPSQYRHPVGPFIAANRRAGVDSGRGSGLEIREQRTETEIKLEVWLSLMCD